jgi:hypothetical protein
MLLSNWDSKHRRDVSRGSNTAIFEHRISPFAFETRYLIIDWGGAMRREGLIVSGATEDEAIRFARALMTRIQARHEALVSSESQEARPGEGRRTIKTA